MINLLNKKKFILLVTCLVFSWFFFDEVYASGNQPDESEDYFEMSIEKLMEVQVVVSASRQEQKINELSVPVTVITAEDIHYSGLTSIPEILRFAPGVDVLEVDRNHYSIGIRGMHEVFSERLLTLVDGRPADSVSTGGPRFQRFPIFLEDVEQIEIVRGPGGASWGANAFTGVINIITKDPDQCLGTFSSFTVNDFGDAYTFLRTVEKKGNLSLRHSLGYESWVSSDDAIRNDDFSSHDFGRNIKYDGKGVYRPNDGTKISFGLGYANLESGDFDFGGGSVGKNDRNTSLRAFVKAERDFGNETSGYLQLFSNYYTIKEQSLLKYSELENGFEGQLNFSPAHDHKSSIGVDIRWVRIDSDRTGDPTEFVYHNTPANEYWVGLFALDRWQVSDRLTIEGQIRVDDYSEVQLDWSGRLSALYAIDDKKNHILRVSTAKAFRAPLMSVSGGSCQRIPHPLVPGTYLLNLVEAHDLKDEETWALEAGYTGKLAEGVLLQVNNYYQRFDRLIGFNTLADPLGIGRTFFVADNIDGADSWGTEVELSFESKVGKLSLWYAYNDFQTDKDDQPIRAYLPARNKAGLTGRMPLGEGLTFNLNYRFTTRTSGEHANPLNVTNPGSSNRLDLSIAKKIFKGNGEIMFGIIDLLCKDNDPVSAVGSLTDHETPGRTFFARVQLHF